MGNVYTSVYTSLFFNFLFCIERKKVRSLGRVQLFATPWTVAHQAPPSMEFSRQEYWSGLPFPPLGDLPDQGLNPGLLYGRQTLCQGSPIWFWDIAN